MSRKTKDRELEDIFLDEIIWRLEKLQKLEIKEPSFSIDYRQNVEYYKLAVHTTCDTILDYIGQAQHLVKQKDNYEALLLDRMFTNGDITTEVFNNYYPDETLIG